MEEADYPGVRVSMESKFDGVITPLKIVWRTIKKRSVMESIPKELLLR